MSDQKHQRTWRNSARVNPKTHLIVVLFVAAMVLIAVGSSGYMFHAYFQHILGALDTWGSLGPDKIRLANEMFDEMLVLGAVFQIIVLLCLALVALNYVFKITGAEHALRRHIREKLGNDEWESVQLRKGDALNAIADELNALSAKQASKNQGTS